MDRIDLEYTDDVKIKEFDGKKLDVINLTSNYAGKERKVFQFLAIPYNIPKGNLACYFPEANVLVPIDYFANISRTPAYKSVPVSLFW